jgi:hypothetical protein
MAARNPRVAPELSKAGFFRPAGNEKAVNQQLPTWQTAKGQTAWLSRLIEAMEKFSRPEWRACPVDPLELVAMRARLARPAMIHRAYGSRPSLRN